jgi:multiple sugar transport system substrate-binding protein
VGAVGFLLADCAPREVVVTKEVIVQRTVQVPVRATVVEEGTAVGGTVVITPAPEPVIVRVCWPDWGEFFNNALARIGAEYMKQDSLTTIEWVFDAEWKETLVAAIAAGRPPDVAYTNWTEQARLANDGLWLPLDAYMARSGLVREDFIRAMYDQSLWEGKLYCVPGGADYVALYYNKDVFAAAGLDPASPPVTADDLVAQSLEILEFDDTGAIQRLGWLPSARQLRAWAHIFGGQWYDKRAKQITAAHPGNIEALEWMKAYVDDLGSDRLAAFKQSLPDSWGPSSPFASQMTVFRFDGYWISYPLDAYAPHVDYGVAFWPTLGGTPEERRNYLVEGWMVGIPAQASERDAGWRFIKHAFVDNAWRTACETTSGNSVVALMELFTQCVVGGLGTIHRMSADFHVFPDTGLAAEVYWPAIPVNGLYRDLLGQAYDATIRGEKGAVEALEEVSANVQAELDRILEGQS